MATIIAIAGSPIQPAALLRKPGGLNKTEGRYWDRLLLDRANAVLHEFRAHAITLRLGPDVRYTPDFFVVTSAGELQFHEVKGPFIRRGDDGMVKLRTAAALFPWFRFVLAQEGKDRVWSTKEIVP